MQIKKIVDVTRKINPGMTVWPNDNKIIITRDEAIKDGHHCNLSSISFGLHTGTHMDSPYHFIEDGKNVFSVDLSRFVGFVKVFEIKTGRNITRDDIKDLGIVKGDTVFFKTTNSDIDEALPFSKDFIAIDETAAWFLANTGIKSIGMDYLSVEAYKTGEHDVHMILLSHEIGIIEGLNLKDAEPGTYFFSALPLRIEDVEGSPVRAVLIEFEP